jgi:DNA-binding response OmpR family regulator
MANGRILIIDDDVDLCEGMAEFLRDEGYTVENTSDPFAGEALIEKGQFDMALLDFKMTGLTGVDILKKIRSKDLKTKIIIVTGRPFIEKLLIEENLSHMVDGIISKPFNPNVLLSKISDLFLKRPVELGEGLS